MLLPRSPELFVMRDKLRSTSSDVKRTATRSCGRVCREHNIVRNYSHFEQFKLWKTKGVKVDISAALPPLSDRNSAGSSTANPQDFSAFSACFAHVLHQSDSQDFSSGFAELFRSI
jgi:hypothetical protein